LNQKALYSNNNKKSPALKSPVSNIIKSEEKVLNRERRSKKLIKQERN
jgi:hypothetical protein